jgi:hypothetical protein
LRTGFKLRMVETFIMEYGVVVDLVIVSDLHLITIISTQHSLYFPSSHR